MIEVVRPCKHCGEDFTTVGPSSASPVNRGKICDTCAEAKRKGYRSSDPCVIRCARFGISISEFERIYAAQDGKCPICLKEVPRDKPFDIDHNHDTGKVRGILHKWCNTALGWMGDDPETLERAAQYLRAHFETEDFL